MRIKLLICLFLGFISFFFGRTFYNNEIENLGEAFTENNSSFYTILEKIKKSDFYSESKEILSLNEILFDLKSIQSLDSNSIKQLDTLFLQIPQESFARSIFLNEQVLFSFYKSHHALLVNQIEKVNDDFFAELDKYKEKLKEALILDPNNSTVRHNFLVLSKFYQDYNLNYQTAKKLGDLVKKQLHTDLLLDSLSIEKKVMDNSIGAKKESLKKIKTESERKQCTHRMQDTLENYITNSNTQKAKNKIVDSLRYHENFDLLFLNELNSGKKSEQIVDDFYSKNYKSLYNKSYSSSIKEISKDTAINNKLQKIICEYLPEECDKNQENKENKEKQDKKENQDQKENNTDQNKQNKEQNGDSDKKKEMQDALDQYNKKQEQNKEEQLKQEADVKKSQNKGSQNQRSNPSKEQQNSNAKDILRKVEEQNDAFQTKKLESMPYNMDDSKPNW